MEISCSTGCKRTVEDEVGASTAGWEYLSISARWRCPTCYRELRAAASIVGGTKQAADTIVDPKSRGALRRETASTILPPSVKG